MPDLSHKSLDIIQHLWPYIAGAFATLIGGVKLWHSDRKQTQLRIINVEKIAEQAVTRAQLKECKDGIEKEDALMLKSILAIREDMREDNKINAVTHQAILEQAAKSQQEIMREILRLHK